MFGDISGFYSKKIEIFGDAWSVYGDIRAST
jgi:hypothetical protein